MGDMREEVRWMIVVVCCMLLLAWTVVDVFGP